MNIIFFFLWFVKKIKIKKYFIIKNQKKIILYLLKKSNMILSYKIIIESKI